MTAVLVSIKITPDSFIMQHLPGVPHNGTKCNVTRVMYQKRAALHSMTSLFYTLTFILDPYNTGQKSL